MIANAQGLFLKTVLKKRSWINLQVDWRISKIGVKGFGL